MYIHVVYMWCVHVVYMWCMYVHVVYMWCMIYVSVCLHLNTPKNNYVYCNVMMMKVTYIRTSLPSGSCMTFLMCQHCITSTKLHPFIIPTKNTIYFIFMF